MNIGLKLKFLIGGGLAITLASLAGLLLHHLLMEQYALEAPWDFLPAVGLTLLLLLLPLWLHLERWIFRPLSYWLQLNERLRGGDLRAATIDEAAIPDDEIGAVMRTHNQVLTRLIETEQKLRQRQEAQFRELLKLAPDAILITDGDGRIILANAQTERMFGYTPDELVGQSVDILLPERLRQRHAEQRAHFYADPQTRSMGADLPLVGQRKDGSEFPVEVSLSALRTPEGLLVTSIVRDVTERRRAAQELRAMNAALEARAFELQVLHDLSQQIGYTLDYAELLRLICAHLHRAVTYDVVASVLIEPQCEISIHSPRPLAPWVQQSLKEQLRTTLSQFSPDAAICEDVPVKIHDTDRSGDPSPPVEQVRSIHQIPLLRKNRPIGLLLVGAEAEDAFSEDQMRLLDTVVEQATASVQRLRALLDAEQKRMENLVQHMPEGVLLLDAEQRLLLANPAAQSILDVLGSVPKGEVLHDLGPEPLQTILERHEEPLPVEITVYDDPSTRIFEAQARAIRNGHEPQWVITLREVTYERMVQQQIYDQERLTAVGQLAAGFAHDVNNVLAVIALYSQTLRKIPDLPQRGQYLDTIHKQVQYATQLVEQILDFSRRSVLQRTSNDLRSFLQKMVTELQQTLPETIQISATAEESIMADVDPARLRRVYMNLALNACDAMPEGGKLHLHLRKFVLLPNQTPPLPDMAPGRWACLTITDSGTGIPFEVQSRIFDPFFSTKSSSGGRGLGLAQVYGIVKQHGGEITVESQQGQGTIFTIYLPTQEEDAPITEESNTTTLSEQSARRESKTILLVEDNPHLRAAMEEALNLLGYHTLTAGNGQEALSIYARHADSVSLVLSDLMMPKMNGVELYRSLKDRWPAVKTIIATASPLETMDGTLMREGIAGWIQKPFSVEELSTKVKQVLVNGDASR